MRAVFCWPIAKEHSSSKTFQKNGVACLPVKREWAECINSGKKKENKIRTGCREEKKKKENPARLVLQKKKKKKKLSDRPGDLVP